MAATLFHTSIVPVAATCAVTMSAQPVATTAAARPSATNPPRTNSEFSAARPSQPATAPKAVATSASGGSTAAASVTPTAPRRWTARFIWPSSLSAMAR